MRMFLAVWPDASTVRRLSAVDLGSFPDLRTVRPDHWHITLRFLGDVADDALPLLVDVLRLACKGVRRPVRCTVGPATTWFGGGRVLQIPVAGLDELAALVRRATVPTVPDDGQAPFVGHLTIARLRGRRRLDGPTWRAAAGTAVSAAFTVTHVLLVASVLSPDGPRYSTLARLPLSA